MITHIWDKEQLEIRDRRTKSPGFFKPPNEHICNQNHICVPTAERAVSARIYPNGEFGVGFVPEKKMSAKERRYDSDCRYAKQNAEIVADIEVNDEHPEGFIYTRKIIPGVPPKLGLGSESSRVCRKYGLNGITSYARKMVRNGGHVLDKAYGGQYNRFMKMGTLTLPSYSHEDMKSICTHWSDIVRKFFQKLKRIYARHRYPFHYVCVTEIQPGRLRERHEVGLHLHFLYVAIRLGRGKWVLHHDTVRQKWRETIGSYLGQDTESQNPNYRCESVSSSSAAYLSKYMSKGGEEVQQVLHEFGKEWLPSQWWSMDNITRKCIKAHTISSNKHPAEMLLVIARWGVGTYIRYIRCITIQLETNQYAEVHHIPKEIVLGYGGLLTADGYALFSPGNQVESIRSSLPPTVGRNHRHFKKYSKSRLTRVKTTS